jgi:hypothetical protein
LLFAEQTGTTQQPGAQASHSSPRREDIHVPYWFTIGIDESSMGCQQERSIRFATPGWDQPRPRGVRA